MSVNTTAAPQRRGRPRSQKARKAILEATAELLLADGLSGVSMDAVAERAGVSKATIYRWWPDKETLALDALYTHWEAAVPASRQTSSLRGDLLALLRPWARLVSQRPYSRVVASLLTKAQADTAFGDVYREHLVQPRRAGTRELFERAAERGEITLPANMEVVLDLLYGPIYLRALQGHAPVTDRFVRDVVDTVVAQLRPPAAGELVAMRDAAEGH